LPAMLPGVGNGGGWGLVHRRLLMTNLKRVLEAG
jgi:hypothetical protein